MPKRIVIIQGHPDSKGGHFCHALADAYGESARASGHAVETIDVAACDFSILRTKVEFDTGPLNQDIKAAQETFLWADHLVVIYPLWLGTMPALLKGFFEQVLRPDFGFSLTPEGRWKKRLKGRSARVIITMGMPALAYRWYFGAHSLRNLKRNILGFCGIGPIRASLVGMVESKNPRGRERWLARMGKYGTRGN